MRTFFGAKFYINKQIVVTGCIMCQVLLWLYYNILSFEMYSTKQNDTTVLIGIWAAVSYNYTRVLHGLKESSIKLSRNFRLENFAHKCNMYEKHTGRIKRK